MERLQSLKPGAKTEVFRFYVSQEDAERFANVVCDPLITEGTRSILPPTYPIVYWQKANLPWLEGIGPLIHGEQSFHYTAHLFTGTNYVGQIELTKVEEKVGKLGKVIWLEHELTVHSPDVDDPPLVVCKTKAMFKPPQKEVAK
jgi:hypothetical protein